MTRKLAGIVMAVAVLATASCKKESTKTQEVFYYSGPVTLEAAIGGQDFNLNFRTNCNWELQIPAEAGWIKANTTSGNGNGTAKAFTVLLTVEANSGKDAREASIKLAYGSRSFSKEIKVRQPSQSSMKGCTVTNITDDILFSTVPAGTSTSVQQGFDFNADKSMMYFSQVTSGYKNTISWTPRTAVTSSTTLATNKLTLLYYSHGNNIHYEKGTDGADYLWIANWGTRDSEGKYTNPQVLSRIKLVNGKTYRPADAEDSYYFGTKTVHASFDVENDHLAIYSQGDGYTMKIYKLSEVLATPLSDVQLQYSLTNGGTANGKTSPDPEYVGKPTIKAHDCRSLKPVASFTNNYTGTRGWQTYCIHGEKVYFFLFYKQTNPAANGMYYQSVIDVFDFKGNKLKGDILQPFADNLTDLIRYGFTDDATRYMENEGILVRDGILYLLYTAKNTAGFRRPVIFQFDASCLD